MSWSSLDRSLLKNQTAVLKIGGQWVAPDNLIHISSFFQQSEHTLLFASENRVCSISPFRVCCNNPSNMVSVQPSLLTAESLRLKKGLLETASSTDIGRGSEGAEFAHQHGGRNWRKEVALLLRARNAKLKLSFSENFTPSTAPSRRDHRARHLLNTE